MPTKADATAQQIAEATNTIVAELRMIPNQPLTFHNDGKPRKEDDLIGYCWKQYLKTGDATWLPRLPMVKSVVRAMDCLQELLASPEGGNQKVEKFVVAGGSKRGWTTWMTGAADRRVEAIIPIVIDCVNVAPSMRHHAAVYGFWAKAVGNYYEHGIMAATDDPRLAQLYAVVDPYFHREKLTMPKYIVNASGDQFFCPDSSQFYFDQLKGEKLLRYVPNADHSLRGSDAVQSIAAYYQMILDNKPRPQPTWTFESDGSIRLRSDQPSTKVVLWQATNPKARDFRVDTIGRAFTSSELKAQADGSYIGRAASPTEGWTAYFLEMSYDTGGKYPLKLSTGVRVTPDKLPFADADPKTLPYEASRSTAK
jgi:PhoPQ-activated pathogenicity-related protein